MKTSLSFSFFLLAGTALMLSGCGGNVSAPDFDHETPYSLTPNNEIPVVEEASDDDPPPPPPPEDDTDLQGDPDPPKKRPGDIVVEQISWGQLKNKY